MAVHKRAHVQRSLIGRGGRYCIERLLAVRLPLTALGYKWR